MQLRLSTWEHMGQAAYLLQRSSSGLQLGQRSVTQAGAAEAGGIRNGGDGPDNLSQHLVPPGCGPLLRADGVCAQPRPEDGPAPAAGDGARAAHPAGLQRQPAAEGCSEEAAGLGPGQACCALGR